MRISKRTIKKCQERKEMVKVIEELLPEIGRDACKFYLRDHLIAFEKMRNLKCAKTS